MHIRTLVSDVDDGIETRQRTRQGACFMVDRYDSQTRRPERSYASEDR
jgi:hypothetical protein